MTDGLGTVVVAIPATLDLPADGVDGGHHVTLVWLGEDVVTENQLSELKQIVHDIAATTMAEAVDTTGYEFFGDEEEIVVLTLDRDDSEIPSRLRHVVLENLTEELLAAFDAAETFPIYRPHITISYGGTVPDRYPDTVRLKALAVWHGEERTTYPLTGTRPA